MVNRVHLNKISFHLFYFGLLLLAVSIPLSKFTMSISQFMIAGGWVLSGNFNEKIQNLKKSPVALLVMGLYLLHVIGLLYTNDFEYAFKDLRIKLPLLILPLIFATAPALSKTQFRNVLIAIIAGTTASTIISFLVYTGIVQRNVNDIRDISIFISHIRLVLMCCVAIFISVFFIYKNLYDKFSVLLLGALILWHLYVIALLQSATGIVIVFTVFLITALYLLIRSNNIVYKITSVVLAVSLITFSVWKYYKIKQLFNIKVPIETVEANLFTSSGSPFKLYADRHEYENGYPVWAFICEEELEEQWNIRSTYNYNELDDRNQEIRFTIIRYITSLGIKKDSAAIWKLSSKDIEAIETGIANQIYVYGDSFDARIHQVIWEIKNYKSGNNPSGHSVAQRFEYWKAAIGIVKKYPIFGVGTGDVPDAFQKQYDEIDSPLKPEWRLRSHNQFLSFAVAFGLTGFLYFLFMCFYPLAKAMQRFDFLYLTFIIAAILSMFTEDTLETQAGVTFFTFFTCLFLFVNPVNRSVDVNPTL